MNARERFPLLDSVPYAPAVLDQREQMCDTIDSQAEQIATLRGSLMAEQATISELIVDNRALREDLAWERAQKAIAMQELGQAVLRLREHLTALEALSAVLACDTPVRDQTPPDSASEAPEATQGAQAGIWPVVCDCDRTWLGGGAHWADHATTCAVRAAAAQRVQQVMCPHCGVLVSASYDHWYTYGPGDGVWTCGNRETATDFHTREGWQEAPQAYPRPRLVSFVEGLEFARMVLPPDEGECPQCSSNDRDLVFGACEDEPHLWHERGDG